MKRIKEKLIRMRRRFRHNKYINGTKGVVSIFLAILMTPLLSLSLLIVETARYQHALQAVEEAADLAANSTLATMDSYLNERFGLLSIDQEEDVGTQFDKYMKADASVIGNHATYTSGSISGKYALSDLDILKQQIAELGELTVPIETVYKGFDVEGFLDKLSEITKFMENLKENIGKVQTAAEILEDVTTLISAAKDVKGDCETYNTKLQAYKDAYSDLEKEIYTTDDSDEDYIAVLKKAISELPADAAEDAEYDVQTVKDAYKDVSEDVTNYKKAAGELKSAIEKLQEDVDALSKAPDILDKVNSLQSGDAFGEGISVLLDVVREPLTQLASSLANVTKEGMQPAINALEAQVIELGKIDNKTIKQDWTNTTVKQKYGPVAAGELTVVGVLKDAVSNFVTVIDSAEVDMGVDGGMGDFVDICTSLFKVQGIYDEALSANVSDASMYSHVDMGLDAKVTMEFVESISSFTKACEDFVDNIGNGILGLVAAAKAVYNLVKAAVTFVGILITTISQTLVMLIDLVSDMVTAGGVGAAARDFYDRMIVYGYGIYNMPNRTTVEESGIYGYDFGDVYTLGSKTSGYVRKGSSESISELSAINPDAGSDSMFFGAEGEYLLAGSNSEKYNQAITFVELFVLRVLLDMPAAFTDAEFQEIASCAGPFFWVVDLLGGLAEGFTDTLILANKGSEPLIKMKLYFTPSGIKNLLEDLWGILEFDTNLKDKIEDFADDDDKDSGSGSGSGGSGSESGGSGSGSGGSGSESGGSGSGSGSSGSGSGSGSGGSGSGSSGSGSGSGGSGSGSGGSGSGSGGSGSGTGDAGGAEESDDGNGFLSVSYTEHLLLMILMRVTDDTYIERIRNIVQMETATNYKEYTFDLDEAYTYFKADITYKINPMLPVDNISDNTKLLTFTTSQYVGY